MMGSSCSSNQMPLQEAMFQEPDPDVPVENKKKIANLYAKQVGMDEANTKGLEVLATEGPRAMFAHMVKESGGDYSRMMAMYH